MQEKLDIYYSDAVYEIKTAILQSQLRAVQRVNREQLALYFGIGWYISENTRKQKWGSGALKNISAQLSIEMPGLKGFSEANLKKMRQFYESWETEIIRSPLATELQPIENEIVDHSIQLLNVNRSPLATELDWNDFFSISFSHHMEILYKTETLEERIFYIHQTALNHWDKYTLRNMLEQKLIIHQNAAPNNFTTTLPEWKQAEKAIKTFKDEYMLDYINVETLGMNDEDIDERVIEQSIIQNIKNFILEFGRGFTFKGSQVHLEKLGHDHWVDLLFFNRELQSLVVVELKKGAFKPAYLGQLAAYLRILDDEEKLPNENPSIGIILCKDADKAYVEYVLQDYNKPMAVATYKLRQEQLRNVLPDEDAMKKILQ